MKKKISELELWEINYLVAKAENHQYRYGWMMEDGKTYQEWQVAELGYGNPTPEYCTNPSQAWPIIERERIYNYPRKTIGGWSSQIASENIRDPYIFAEGKTSLESAMRCFACSVYGEEIEI